jgi:hypothetical protein
MSRDFLLGALCFPVGILVLGFSAVVFRALLRVGAKITDAGVQRLTPETAWSRRAACAAVVVGARRAWMLAVGDVGVIVVVGHDAEEARTAARRLSTAEAAPQLSPRFRRRMAGDDS